MNITNNTAKLFNNQFIINSLNIKLHSHKMTDLFDQEIKSLFTQSLEVLN